MHWLSRSLVFTLGLLILLDAIFEKPSQILMILVGLVLMGIISVDQLVSLVMRNREEEKNGTGTSGISERSSSEGSTSVSRDSGIREGTEPRGPSSGGSPE
jgi:hypothetical protein